MRHARWVRPWLLFAVLAIALANASWAQQQVRVASYNIRFLSTAVTTQGDRLQKLRELIDLLDADVISLQEIDNRAALELLFPPADWQVIIDDDSGEDQDVAIAVRRPLTVRGLERRRCSRA